MDTITVRIPRELKETLEAITRETDVSVSDLVRESLRRYTALLRFRRLREKTLPFAEAQGILTDEDVFRIVS